MTDRQEAYHNAAINGETPETLDPRHTIPGHSARQENSWPQETGLKKYDISTGEVGAPAGPSGIHLVATQYFGLA